MANDVAQVIYELAKSDEDLSSQVHIEFAYSHIDDENNDKNKEIIRLKLVEKNTRVVIKTNKFECYCSYENFETIVQMILHRIAKQQKDDAIIADFCNISIKVQFRNEIVSECLFFFRHTMTSNEIIDYESWYEDARTHTMHNFINRNYEFAKSLLDISLAKPNRRSGYV